MKRFFALLTVMTLTLVAFQFGTANAQQYVFSDGIVGYANCGPTGPGGGGSFSYVSQCSIGPPTSPRPGTFYVSQRYYRPIVRFVPRYYISATPTYRYQRISYSNYGERSVTYGNE